MDKNSVLEVYDKDDITSGVSCYREKVQHLLELSVSPETRRAYSCRIRRFISWSAERGLNVIFPVAPEILSAYIAYLAEEGFKYSTLEQTLAAISAVHKAEGLASPTESMLVKKIVKGFKREYGTAKKSCVNTLYVKMR